MAGLAIAAGLPIAACGGDSDEERAADVAKAFLAALADEDGTAACELVDTRATPRDVCVRLVEFTGAALDPGERQSLREAAVRVEVDGDSALALPDGSARRLIGRRVPMVRRDDAWRIESFAPRGL